MSDSYGDSPNCLNCGAPLAGQYCGRCGQRATGRLISLWELIRDAFGDLFELDSRLWRTLTPLLIRPGALTNDYLRGRRARYMPPFRMYLVLSLIFFVVAFFNPGDDFSNLFEPATESAPQTSESVQEPESENADDEETKCNIDEFNLDGVPHFIQGLTPERVQQICREIIADNGRQLLKNLLDNIPAALIVLLPFMAFALKLLYPLSRRYYVEHLLFFVHFHAFSFLILSLQIVFSRFTSLLHLPDAISIITSVGVSLYIPVYLFKAMRCVYAQSWFLSFLKYSVVFVAYLLGLSVTMLGALSIAVFSI